MGQYHILVNLDKREFVHPHQLGAGLKMWEFTNTRTGPLAALSMLLVSSKSRGGGDCREDNPILGSCAGDRIAIIGDYRERDDLAPEHNADIIYGLCSSEEEVSESIERYQQIAKDSSEDVDNYGNRADRMLAAKPYTNISEQIRPLVEDFCGVKISGDGWLNIEPVEEWAK